MSVDRAVQAQTVIELPIDWLQQTELDINHAELRDSVHLWTFDLADLDLESLGKQATALEASRAARILSAHKRLLYLGGRVGLRLLLCRYTGLESKDLRIGYGHRGKPRLENTPFSGELTFNYTLSDDKVLYAIGVDRQLGVDLEKLPRKLNAALMAKNKLAVPEQDAWRNVVESEKDTAMLSCWTRKEAYGKATGVGIRFYLNQVVLFTNLHQPWFQTTRTGLFEDTTQLSMPSLLEGVQIALPFSGVATLMYERHNADESQLPILAARLKI